eukprot:228395-Alexandrium_andersonii.AAC.1
MPPRSPAGGGAGPDGASPGARERAGPGSVSPGRRRVVVREHSARSPPPAGDAASSALAAAKPESGPPS